VKTAAASRARLVRFSFTSDDSGEPTQIPLSAPHMVLPPLAANGLPTAGLTLALIRDDADFASINSEIGLTVTVYALMPVVGRWIRVAVFSGVGHHQQVVTRDVGGGAQLFFRISNLGPGGGEVPDYGRITVAVAALG
jgi:hypothetical protein